MSINFDETTDAEGVFNFVKVCKKTCYLMTSLGKMIITVPTYKFHADSKIRYYIYAQDFDSVTFFECTFTEQK